MATSTTGGALYKVGANVIDTSKTDAAIAQKLKDSKAQAERDYQQSVRDQARADKLKLNATNRLANRETGGDERHEDYLKGLYDDVENYYTTIMASEGGPTYEELTELDKKIKDNNAWVVFSRNQKAEIEKFMEEFDPHVHTVESMERLNEYLDMVPEEQIKNYAEYINLEKRPEYIDEAVFMEQNYKNDFVHTGTRNQYTDYASMNLAVRDLTTKIIDNYVTPNEDGTGNEEWDYQSSKNPLYNYYKTIKDNGTIMIFDETKGGWTTVNALDYLENFSDDPGSLKVEDLVEPEDGWFMNQMIENPEFKEDLAESAENKKMIPKEVSLRDYKEYRMLKDKIYDAYDKVQKPNRKITRTGTSTDNEQDYATGGAGKKNIGYRDNQGSGKLTKDLSYDGSTDFSTVHSGGKVTTFAVKRYYNTRTQNVINTDEVITPTSNVHVYNGINVATENMTIEVDGKNINIQAGQPVGDSILPLLEDKYKKQDLAFFKTKIRGREVSIYTPADDIEGALGLATGKEIDYK